MPPHSHKGKKTGIVEFSQLNSEGLEIWTGTTRRQKRELLQIAKVNYPDRKTKRASKKTLSRMKRESWWK